ncbi:MAG: DUF2551 domain-containing protein [Methanospirillaceae archaeon]|nr:DUF2551 domain-containing protein [Methanospirillaceae archaeon]
MTSSDQIRQKVQDRLSSYLKKDTQGLRRAVIRVFLCGEKLSIQQIYDYLKDRFKVTYHMIAGMIGIISSRIGILHVCRDIEIGCCFYQIKKRYISLVSDMLAS